MRIRRPLLTLLSASLFIASTAFAAAPPPPDDPPVERPTALWVYYEAPAPQWYVLDDFDTKEACEKALPEVKVTPPPKAADCFRVGIPVNEQHPQYGTITAKPPGKAEGSIGN